MATKIFTDAIKDPKSITSTRRLIRERNRAARLRHDVLQLQQHCDELEEERDDLGEELDVAVKTVALLMNIIMEHSIPTQNIRRFNIVELRNARLLLERYGYELAPHSEAQS